MKKFRGCKATASSAAFKKRPAQGRLEAARLQGSKARLKARHGNHEHNSKGEGGRGEERRKISLNF